MHVDHMHIDHVCTTTDLFDIFGKLCQSTLNLIRKKYRENLQSYKKTLIYNAPRSVI
jgi:hypothetical protein